MSLSTLTGRSGTLGLGPAFQFLAVAAAPSDLLEGVVATKSENVDISNAAKLYELPVKRCLFHLVNELLYE